MNVSIYSSIYGKYDTLKVQPLPVTLFTDESHPMNYPSRFAAKWWKFHPTMACPNADVTIWIDGNMLIARSDLIELSLEALGDADALFIKHPARDCIYTEAAFAKKGVKYDGMPLVEQAEHYRSQGHPEHWGLASCGFMVRRNNEKVRALGEAWWGENMKWSTMDQISLPPLLRTMDIKVKWHEKFIMDGSWVQIHRHLAPDEWRA